MIKSWWKNIYLKFHSNIAGSRELENPDYVEKWQSGQTGSVTPTAEWFGDVWSLKSVEPPSYFASVSTTKLPSNINLTYDM